MAALAAALLASCMTSKADIDGQSASAQTSIMEGMPVLARHAGTWDGVFRRYDADGALIAEFPSTIVTQFPEDGEFDYRQTNTYQRNGENDIVIRSAGTFDGDRLRFSNARVEGWVVDDPTDEFGRSTLLFFRYLDGSGTYVYETVQISDDGRRRHRATQYYNADGSLQRRTLIDEVKRD